MIICVVFSLIFSLRHLSCPWRPRPKPMELTCQLHLAYDWPELAIDVGSQQLAISPRLLWSRFHFLVGQRSRIWVRIDFRACQIFWSRRFWGWIVASASLDHCNATTKKECEWINDWKRLFMTYFKKHMRETGAEVRSINVKLLLAGQVNVYAARAVDFYSRCWKLLRNSDR